MEFFNNKENESLKFKLNSEGVDINKIEARLILKGKGKSINYLLIGEMMNNEVCKFDVPKLELFEKGDIGTIKFEIISDDLYFPVWSDNFEIKTKANIKIEEMITQINKEEDNQPKKSVKAVFEGTEPVNKPEKDTEKSDFKSEKNTEKHEEKINIEKKENDVNTSIQNLKIKKFSEYYK